MQHVTSPKDTIQDKSIPTVVEVLDDTQDIPPDANGMETTGTDATMAIDDPSSPSGPGSGGARRLEPGTRVGRYLVLECIGQGAMGQVYAAFDPELDRKIALKILRVSSAAGSSSSHGVSTPSAPSTESSPRRRLMREAKALSQLAHPNVVAVHDVGSIGDEVFVAMEFVAGMDLRHWSREKPRTWKEVLEVYIQAGQGLAAAHAAGLVHRDFKPQNAILGSDGRVRVLDFGLATPRSNTQHGDASSGILDQVLEKSGSSSDGWERLTQTGALLGTPAFMALEVIMGKGADDKSDQFSFSASLFQALYGSLPFEGRTLREIGEAITAGRVKEHVHRSVPHWLHKAVLRGLSADADRRFPSMEAMLTVLERRDPATRRTRWAIRGMLTAVAVVVLGVAFTQVASRQARLCQGAQHHLVDVWDANRKDAVQQAMTATGLTYAQDSWTRVQAELDGYTRGWVTMHQEACEATHVRGEQSGDMLDLRMRCLKERLGEVKALVDVLSRADPDVVQKAVPAVNSLVALSTCADGTALRSSVPLPRDAQTAQQVEALRQRLEHARALEKTGKYVDGMEEVQQLEPETRALGYQPLVAELLLLKGILLSDRGKYPEAVAVLEEADLTSSSTKHVMVTAMAQRELVQVVGYFLMKFEEGLVRARYARVTLQQADLFDKLGDRLFTAVGNVLARKGEPDKAIEQHQRALELCTAHAGADQCSAIMLSLGTANYFAGHFDEGQRLYRQTMAIMERTLGATHPNFGKTMNNYGLLLSDMGRYDEAMEWLQRARSVYEQSYGKEHPLTGDNLNNIANVHWWKGDYENAIKTHQRALDIRTKATGRSHSAVAGSYQNLGIAYQDLGMLDLAQQNMAQCLEIRTAVLGPDHEKTLGCLFGVASIQVAQGRFDQAEPVLEKVLGLWSKALGPDHPILYEPLLDMGRVHLARRDFVKAAAYVERALEILERKKIINKFTVNAHLLLAKVLWEIPERRKQSIPHAQQAAEMLSRINANHPALADEISRWLQAHKP